METGGNTIKETVMESFAIDSEMSSIKLSVVFFLFEFLTFSLQDNVSPKVNTNLGSISGYYKESQHGKKYEAYEGIPYAEPPVGELRFEPPKPVQKWGYELSAKKQGSICMQYLMSSPTANEDRVVGCEDCLYMNIYVSITNSSKNLLPVMFWIHGGAFQFGTGNELDERRLMDRDIILVTFNYRLGPFGFLSTGDHVVPGNMGLKDQSMALRWVHDNINNFGGDPNQITIWGLSAGGTSVHYHYLSALSGGLFKRGISISGLALNPRSLTKRAPERAKKLGALMGCPTDTIAEMIACLKYRPPRPISQAVGDFMYWLYNPASPFAPVVEQEGPNSFISKSPFEIIKSGMVQDVPWITGVVRDEGLFPSREFIGNDQLLKHLNDNWDDIAPYLLSFNDTIPVDHHKQVAEKIREFYLGSKKIDRDTVMPLIHMIGDRSYGVGMEKTVKLQAKVNKSPVWAYYYTYETAINLHKSITGFGDDFALVGHGDDVSLVIDKATSSITDPEDLKMQQLLIDFYTSFAIQGKPHVSHHFKWQSQERNKKDLCYLHIASPENLTMECNGNFAQKNFWNTIDFDENKL